MAPSDNTAGLRSDTPTSPLPGRPIRIGIDGRNLQGKRRGDGRYVFELCRKMDKQMPNDQFIIYSSIPVEMPVVSDRWILRTDPLPFSKLPPLVWLKLRGSLFCLRDHLDVFWGTNTFLPILSPSVRRVVTVHDFCYLLVPETFIVPHLWVNRLFFKRDVCKSDIILTNSRGTAKRLYDLMGLRTTVIHPAVGDTFKQQSDDQIKACLKRYALSYPYLLNVSVWEPRKNQELLAKTFIKMKNQGLLPDHKLVLVGKPFWKCRQLINLIARDEGRNIVSLGYVPDEHLPPLYAGADLFVFPSVYEGFGIPVLEAKACGTRVVATDIPELHEPGGSDTLYIEPTHEGIREGILRALKQSKTCLPPSGIPTWETGAMKLAAIFRGSL